MLAPEINIAIGGEEKVMRPTIKSLMAIEKELGVGIMKLAAKMEDFDFSVTEMVCIIFHGLQGGANGLPREVVISDMEQHGLTHWLAPVSQFIVAALSGGDAKKKPQAAK